MLTCTQKNIVEEFHDAEVALLKTEKRLIKRRAAYQKAKAAYDRLLDDLRNYAMDYRRELFHAHLNGEFE
jgi:hypothetical protein